MSKSVHVKNAKDGLKISLPKGISEEKFEFYLNKFNNKIEESGLNEEMARRERFIKPFQVRKLAKHNKLKSIRRAEKIKREAEEKYWDASITK